MNYDQICAYTCRFFDITDWWFVINLNTYTFLQRTNNNTHNSRVFKSIFLGISKMYFCSPCVWIRHDVFQTASSSNCFVTIPQYVIATEIVVIYSALHTIDTLIMSTNEVTHLHKSGHRKNYPLESVVYDDKYTSLEC